jgi:hypothetical protein
MYLLIRHELNEETKARRDEVAKAKARNRQRVAQLRQISEEPSHTTGTLSNTQAKARAKDRTRVGNTHESKRSDRHQPTRAWKGNRLTPSEHSL